MVPLVRLGLKHLHCIGISHEIRVSVPMSDASADNNC